MQAKMFWTRLFLVYPVYSDIVFLAFEIKISCGYTVGRRRSEIVQWRLYRWQAASGRWRTSAASWAGHLMGCWWPSELDRSISTVYQSVYIGSVALTSRNWRRPSWLVGCAFMYIYNSWQMQNKLTWRQRITAICDVMYIHISQRRTSQSVWRKFHTQKVVYIPYYYYELSSDWKYKYGKCEYQGCNTEVGKRKCIFAAVEN